MNRKPRKSNDISWDIQCLYLVLYACAAFCGLFLKGHPNVMFGCLAAAPVAMAISRLPMRWLPALVRQLFQLVIVALAVVWCKFRIQECQVDVLLIEFGAILGTALFIGRRIREHTILLLLSFVLIGYGGLQPSRPFFMHVFLLALATTGFLFYQTRTSLLASIKAPDEQVFDLPRHQGNKLYKCLHLTLAILITLLLLAKAPQTQRIRTKGLIPVSFNTEHDVHFDNFWEKWSKPTQNLLSGKSTSSSEQVDSKEEAPVLSQEAQKLLNLKDAPAFDAQSGQGMGHSIGTSLVFRAYSPAKLYWLVQLYDTYDGKIWSQSYIMKSGHSGIDRYNPIHKVMVPQHISLEAPQGFKLPYAFKAVRANLRSQPQEDGRILANVVLKDTFTLMMMGRQKPIPPWNYRVLSIVPNPEAKAPPRAWREPQRNYGWTYRALPQDIISPRLRELADAITAGTDNPYEKAVKIRDYLRTNYKYDIKAPAIPEGMEVVDYFLFESKVGYCQHFAQAFTVLARLAGLHSRLATGYSPGNYNLLSNTFEVYEYHAHAWTQIFIEPYGWMTFDGVAPGNLNIENTPKMLSPLLDPFGSEWNARPPEMTYIPPPRPGEFKKPPEGNSQKQQHDGNSDTPQPVPGQTLFGQVYAQAALNSNSPEPTDQELIKAAYQVFSEKIKNICQRGLDRTKAFMSSNWDRLKRFFTHIWQAFLRFNWFCKTLVLLAIACLVALFLKRQRIMQLIAYHWRLHHSHAMWCRRLKTSVLPQQQVLACQEFVTSLLDMTIFKCPPTMDLLERIDYLKVHAPNVSADYSVIAQAAEKAKFTTMPVEHDDCRHVVAKTSRLYLALKPYLHC